MRRDRALEHVEFWRALLAPEWTITTRFNVVVDGDPRAVIDPAEDYHAATLKFTDGWAKGWPDQRADEWSADAELEATACHEVLHLVTRDLDHHAGMGFHQLSASAKEIAGTAHTHALEGVVERLARAMVAVRRGGTR